MYGKSFFRLLLLVILLNLIRYLLGMPLEALLIFERLMGEMERHASYFNTEFSRFDWATSYFYNFMMWFSAAWVFVISESSLGGNYLVKSLKVYGLMYLFFASVSAIYMNHYSHPKGFYIYNILDGLLVYALVAAANSLLYPRLFPRAESRTRTPGAA